MVPVRSQGLEQSSSGARAMAPKLVAFIAVLYICQMVTHGYSSNWQGGRDPSRAAALLSPPDLAPATPHVAFEALSVKMEVAKVQQPVCKHGGIETGGGCICGYGTAGMACEHMTVSRDEVESYKVCGPECWPITVWYPTDSFKLRNFEQPGRDKREDEMRWLMEDILAWKDGGQPRGVDETSQDMHRDPVLLEIMSTLGPWTAHDKHMLRALYDFRVDERAGRLPPVDLEAAAKRRGNATIVFGLMLHDNVARFQALWDVLFDESHYYIIHIDTGTKKGDHTELPATRADFLRVIDSTPYSGASSNGLRGKEKGGKEKGSVWDRVYVLDEADSLDTMWGDITLVYSEVLLWIHLLRRQGWDWDYFINLSGADIPLMRLGPMSAFLGGAAPRSFIYHHENKDEFRQMYVMAPKQHAKHLVVFSTLQKDSPYGRVRERMGITRLTGNSQWHALHRPLLTLLTREPNVARLLFSFKHTSIPDESFFSTAALWVQKTHPSLVKIEASDLRYWNERFGRDLSEHGELRAIKELGDNRQTLFARKSNSAIVTCAYTNRLLHLHNDCSRYRDTGPFPRDAKAKTLPRREDPEETER